MANLSNASFDSKSYLFMTIAILGWGFSVPFIEFGLKNIAPLPFLSYRFILVIGILTPIMLKYRLKEFTILIKNYWVWIIGISESLGLILQYLGQESGVPAGLATLLSLCFLLFVPFLSPIILGEILKKQHGIAIVVGFIGLVFISTEGDLDNLIGGSISFIGIILLLGAAFSYAVYIVTTSRLTTIEEDEVDTFTLFYLVLLIVAVSSSLGTIVFSSFTTIEQPVWIWLVLLVIFSTIIAFFAYFEALKGISANTASVLLLLQVIVPFFIDFVFLDRTYGIWIIAGSFLIVVAMIIVVTIPYFERQIQNKRLNLANN